jgi:hypothetical protein
MSDDRPQTAHEPPALDRSQESGSTGSGTVLRTGARTWNSM